MCFRSLALEWPSVCARQIGHHPSICRCYETGNILNMDKQHRYGPYLIYADADASWLKITQNEKAQIPKCIVIFLVREKKSPSDSVEVAFDALSQVRTQKLIQNNEMKRIYNVFVSSYLIAAPIITWLKTIFSSLCSSPFGSLRALCVAITIARFFFCSSFILDFSCIFMLSHCISSPCDCGCVQRSVLCALRFRLFTHRHHISFRFGPRFAFLIQLSSCRAHLLFSHFYECSPVFLWIFSVLIIFLLVIFYEAIFHTIFTCGRTWRYKHIISD